MGRFGLVSGVSVVVSLVVMVVDVKDFRSAEFRAEACLFWSYYFVEILRISSGVGKIFTRLA